MKKTSLCIGFIALAFLVVGVFAGPASAQVPPDFSVWDGSLWQIKQTGKGLYWAPGANGAYTRKFSGSDSIYGVLETEGMTGTVNLYLFEYVKGNEFCDYMDRIPLNYVRGNELNFLTSFYAANGSLIAGAVYFSGTQEGGSIKKGNVTSVGAVVIEQGFDAAGDLAAYGLTLKGKVITERQLKCRITLP